MHNHNWKTVTRVTEDSGCRVINLAAELPWENLYSISSLHSGFYRYCQLEILQLEIEEEKKLSPLC